MTSDQEPLHHRSAGASVGDQILLRLRRPEDDEQLVALSNRHFAEFPPYTVDQFRSLEERRSEAGGAERWVAELDGVTVGMGAVFQRRGSEPGTVSLDTMVHHDWQGRRIGTTVYQHLMQRVRARGATRLYASVLDNHPYALSVAVRHGFHPTGHGEQFSRLDVRAVDRTGDADVEARLRREGITIDRLADMDMDDTTFMHALFEMEQATHGDIPRDEPYRPTPYETWLSGTHRAGRSPEWCWVALAGKAPVGIAWLSLTCPDAAWSAYTGVEAAYRGKGIARALKCRTIQWSRDHGVQYLYTASDVKNHRMRAVNARFGYQPLAREITLACELSIV